MRLLFVMLSGAILVAGAVSDTPRPLDPALLHDLRWRSIGPANTGGRIDDFAVAKS